MKQTSWLAVGVVCGFTLAVAPSCGAKPTCTTATCPTGCCTAAGTCEPGNVAGACGSNGTTCKVCNAGLVCQTGFCESLATGGGTGGGSATGGGTGGGTATGGGSGGGGGTMVDPDAGVAILFGQACTNPQPCGGDIVGTWRFTSYCQTTFLPQSVYQLCPSVTATATGELKGSLSFTDATPKVANFSATSVVDVKAFIPQSCIMPLPGITLPCSGTSGSVQSLLQGQLPGARCSAGDGGMGCDCDFRVTQTNSTVGEYTTSNGTISVNTGTATQTYTYCVSNNQLHYKETSAQPKESGTGILVKQ
ncbi:MAG: hypothetical protein JNG84_08695 [Archangium sp.]|nr:hypothetical protein [Archangium sp.]